MFIGYATALAGLQAAGRMLGVSAHNIANGQTDGFKRVRAIPEENVAGGVRVTLDQDQSSGPLVHSVVENDLPMQEGSNLDLTEELTATLQASHLYEANLASLRIQDKAVGSLLDLFE